jgi:hypothetical protein
MFFFSTICDKNAYNTFGIKFMLRPWAHEHIFTTKYINGCNHNPTNQKGIGPERKIKKIG